MGLPAIPPHQGRASLARKAVPPRGAIPGEPLAALECVYQNEPLITYNIYMELQGKIIKVCELRQGTSRSSGNPWASQDYVLETHDQYPRRMMFNVFGDDKIKEFAIKEGEEVTVSFDISAREFNGRWYNDVRAWRVVRGAAAPQQPVAAPYAAPQQPYAAPQQPYAAPQQPYAAPQQPAAPQPAASQQDSTDDLPF